MTSSETRGIMSGLVTVICMMCWGCGQEHNTVERPAHAIVAYWPKDVVVSVSDGILPPRTSGWSFTGPHDGSQRESRYVRILSAGNARKILRAWASGGTGGKARYALFPLSIEHEEDERSMDRDSQVFEAMLAVAILTARDLEMRYLVVLAPPSQVESVGLQLSSWGLIDDTPRLRRLLADALRGKGVSYP
jgi:hypothetical protein